MLKTQIIKEEIIFSIIFILLFLKKYILIWYRKFYKLLLVNAESSSILLNIKDCVWMCVYV